MFPSSLSFFVVAGPTAVGKSEVAVALAERCQGEIVGADAFQIYRQLDVLTAKPPRELIARVPHHLIGEIPIDRPFHVAEYLALAKQRVAEIQSRGRTPIVVGGTGLYLRALTHGLADLPGPDAALRAELSSLSLVELQQRLATLDQAASSQIDVQNPRRVIRAIEICLLTGRPFSSFREQWQNAVEIRGALLDRSRDDLYARIDLRTRAMFAANVEEEVRLCPHAGPTASQAIGYRQLRELLDGQLSREDCIAQIQQATRRYAKRQLTWFRRETYLKNIPISPLATVDEIVACVVESAVEQP